VSAWLPNTGSRPKEATRRFLLSCNRCGIWKLVGANSASARSFPDLAKALDFARVESHAEAATIEMFVDGLYICLHQPKGWPHPVCLPHHVIERQVRCRPFRHRGAVPAPGATFDYGRS
jgi:hypothetical protein